MIPILEELPIERPSDEELRRCKRILWWSRFVAIRRPWCVVVPDNGLYGELQAGDVMLVNEDLTHRTGSIVLAVVDGEPVIRRYTKLEGEEVLLESHPNAPPMRVSGKRLHVLGVYDGHYRPSKRMIELGALELTNVD